MNDFRSIGVPAEGSGSDIGRKALWVIRELGLPAIVKPCVSCRSTRHHPTQKFRVNANGKLLDIWMLICCELCGRTSKIPIHERIYAQALQSEWLLMFENNDPAMVRVCLRSSPDPGPPARSACPSPGPAAPRPPGSPDRTSCASLPSPFS